MNPIETVIETGVNAATKLPTKTPFHTILKEALIFLFIALGIVLPFRMYIAEPYLVDGRSMDPTFATSQYLIVNKLSYKMNHSLPRGAVVVFQYPNDTSKNFIKRVIGLPGETVSVKNGVTTIVNNEHPEGFVVDESFVTYKSTSENITKTLAPDEYFVMGDNRNESFDSRAWGPLNKQYILGEPVLRLLPVSKVDIHPGKKNL